MAPVRNLRTHWWSPRPIREQTWIPKPTGRQFVDAALLSQWIRRGAGGHAIVPLYPRRSEDCNPFFHNVIPVRRAFSSAIAARHPETRCHFLNCETSQFPIQTTPVSCEISASRVVDTLATLMSKSAAPTLGCLVAVYRTYKEWKDLKISKKMARHIAKYFETPLRKGMSPVRTLIDVTFPALDAKQKSRWSRALEFAALTKVPQKI